jgi:hypothetical protein
MSLPKRSLMIATFNYGNVACQGTIDYLIDVCFEARNHPVFENRVYRLPNINTTPVDMARNRAVYNAIGHGVDYLLMIDSDTVPDLYVDADGSPHPDEPNARRFLTSSIEWMLARPEPTVVAAPYCGPPPHENVYVFRWANKQSDCPGPQFGVAQYSREEAIGMSGIQEAAALPTGCMLIDMRIFKNWKPPFFYYEFNADCTNKDTTEDVAFSRDLLVYGFKGYCNWDSWCGHVKSKTVGKPTLVRPDDHVLAEIKKSMNFYKRIREADASLPQLASAPACASACDAVESSELASRVAAFAGVVRE